jgi:hypothetical protein
MKVMLLLYSEKKDFANGGVFMNIVFMNIVALWLCSFGILIFKLHKVKNLEEKV